MSMRNPLVRPVRRWRSVAVLMVDAIVVVLALAVSVYAAPCPPEKENFIDFVTGGDECLALEVHNRKMLKTAEINLIIGIHGDGGSKPIRDFVKTLGLRRYKDKAAITIIRPGHVTTYNNAGPGDVETRASTGYKDQYGIDSYTKENISAVMEAVKRLRDHYKPQKVAVIGFSGGAAILGAGLGMFPQIAPEINVLVAYPCDLDIWTSSNGWRSRPFSISPSSVINTIPQHIQLIVIAGSKDNNTSSEMIQGCVSELKKAGKKVDYIETAADHNSALSAPEVKAAIMGAIQTQNIPAAHDPKQAVATGVPVVKQP